MLPLKEDLTLMSDPSLAGDPVHTLRWVGIGVALFVVAGFALWQRRRRPVDASTATTTPTPEDPRDWLQHARHELAKGDPVAAVACADHALRLCLETELRQPCTSLTTRELALALAHRTAPEAQRLITNFFVPADTLRFSGLPPSLPAAVELVATATHHVETLHPASPSKGAQ